MHNPSKLAAALLACLFVAAPAIAADKSSGKGAVATVNGVAISQGIYDAVLNEQRGRGLQDNAETREAVRDFLIGRELMIQEARKQGLDKNASVAALMEHARQNVLVNAFIQEQLRKNAPSEAQLKAEYELIAAKVSGNEYKSRHILVDSEDAAKAIVKQLKDGAKFEDLAKQSKDPGSAENGGDLGWSAPGNYVQPFAEALTKLEKGKFTETPVKTQFGWHVILLEDARPLQPPPFEALKPQLAQRANQQIIEKLVESLRAKAKIQ